MVKLIKDTCGYLIEYDGAKAGVIEYEPFWQGMPYMNLIKLSPEYRRRGIGSEAMRLFEEKLYKEGNKALITSTQSNECAQHFYRKLGYRECGCLILENSPFPQPMEMFFMKTL